MANGAKKARGKQPAKAPAPAAPEADLDAAEDDEPHRGTDPHDVYPGDPRPPVPPPVPSPVPEAPGQAPRPHAPPRSPT